MANFSLVDVKSISSDIPRSNFAEADLDSLAEMIIQAEGIIRPLVVKMSGIETYTVVEGHFEYYAAVRAREKNPRKGEMVNAFVISPKMEDLVLKQATILKGVESPQAFVKAPAQKTSSQPVEINRELSSLEKQLSELRIEITQKLHNSSEAIQRIESQVPKRITAIEAFNTSSLVDLIFRLKTAGFTDKKAKDTAEIIDKERNRKAFESLNDVIERVKTKTKTKTKTGVKSVKAISADKMIKIIDTWSNLLFI
ncbi:MAG: chromosome partitioning protein ParB [Scytonematopsis contorta HA4267-MV1]|jgi:hypothetical protein|nr:chromosome partitioning protein ParB [Scytonematopsis contorta HA4267-MV1]